jgi:hypothetical protein
MDQDRPSGVEYGKVQFERSFAIGYPAATGVTANVTFGGDSVVPLNLEDLLELYYEDRAITTGGLPSSSL